jgi:CBS domain-containing protein
MMKSEAIRTVMSRPVRKLTMNARVRDAAQFLRRRGISGAPVMDEHGRPVGVFSLSDLAGHMTDRLLDLPAVDPAEERAREGGELIPTGLGFHFEGFDESPVSDLMTPGIVCVDPDDPIEEAMRLMDECLIHRVFVRKGDGPLEGVITTMDVLRWTRRALLSRGRARKARRVG